MAHVRCSHFLEFLASLGVIRVLDIVWWDVTGIKLRTSTHLVLLRRNILQIQSYEDAAKIEHILDGVPWPGHSLVSKTRCNEVYYAPTFFLYAFFISSKTKAHFSLASTLTHDRECMNLLWQ